MGVPEWHIKITTENVKKNPSVQSVPVSRITLHKLVCDTNDTLLNSLFANRDCDRRHSPCWSRRWQTSWTWGWTAGRWLAPCASRPTAPPSFRSLRSKRGSFRPPSLVTCWIVRKQAAGVRSDQWPASVQSLQILNGMKISLYRSWQTESLVWTTPPASHLYCCCSPAEKEAACHQLVTVTTQQLLNFTWKTYLTQSCYLKKTKQQEFFLTTKECSTAPLKASKTRSVPPLVERRMSLPSLLNLRPVHSHVRSYWSLKVAKGPWGREESCFFSFFEAEAQIANYTRRFHISQIIIVNWYTA